MAGQTYQLPYDDKHDKDIHDWLQSLPRSRKGEIVRYAIRHYMKSIGEEVSPLWAPETPQTTVAVKKVDNEITNTNKTKKKPSLPTDGEI